MPEVKFRPYQPSDADTISLMSEDFIDYIASLDPMHRIVRQPDYGKNYLEKNLQEVSENHGIFLIAKINDSIVGFGIAVVAKLDQDDLMEMPSHIQGRVTELYISSQYRGQGIGTSLMQQLEAYLKTQNCTSVNIGVFAPNLKTHQLYEKLGYSDRNVDLIKLL